MIPGVASYHPREEWQQTQYPVSGPSDLASDNDTAVIHYTAAPTINNGDIPGVLRAHQRDWTLNRGYSIGYLFAVDQSGGVWQLRGWEYQSAANKGHNSHTVPILMLVDGAEMATPSALDSARKIIAEGGRRAGRPLKVVGHQEIGATACPGVGLMAQIRAGSFGPITAPKPLPPKEDMSQIAYIATPPAFAAPNSPWLIVMDADVRYATSYDTQAGLPVYQLNSEQYTYLRKSAGL